LKEEIFQHDKKKVLLALSCTERNKTSPRKENIASISLGQASRLIEFLATASAKRL